MVLYRAEGLLDEQRIRETTIVYAGLGSLGSQVADALPYEFGGVILADPDEYTEENRERHVLGRSQVGRLKVVAMAEYLADHGYNANAISVHQGPAEDVLEDCPPGTIVVASVDGYEPRANINAICHRRNLPVVFGGVFPKGTGGDITVLPRPTEVCYLCASWLTQSDYSGRDHGNYGVDPRQHQDLAQAVVPALKAPVKAIAARMAMSVLELVSGEPVEPRTHRAVHTWETMFHFPFDDSRARAVGNFQTALTDTGVEPNWRIGPSEGGLTVEVKSSTVSFVLSTWTGCPLHSNMVSLDEI